jgi:hypothetical protein ORF009|nr:MAG TPA: minor structural protein GP20 [Caudoviricetes sp.]
MKLKRKISQSELEQLTKEVQELYTKVGDEFILNLDDTAFETLKAEKKSAEEKLAKYEAEEEERIRKAEERAKKKAQEEYEKAKGDKDVEAIEKSWTDKYGKLESEFKDLQEKHNGYVTKSLVDSAVTAMANEISTHPNLITPHIRSRLGVDLSGDSPKLVVLDENGQRSALTVDELKKSFIDNKEFSAIIKATSANGGAKAGANSPSGTPTGEQPKRLGEMSDLELAQIAKANLNSQE